MSIPPESTRYCLGCCKKTIWRYNRIAGHSRCTECGCAYATENEVDDTIIEKLKAKYMPWIYNK